MPASAFALWTIAFVLESQAISFENVEPVSAEALLDDRYVRSDALQVAESFAFVRVNQ